MSEEIKNQQAAEPEAITVPFFFFAVSSMSVAVLIICSSSIIRPSIKACSFLASSYSEFSLISP